MCSSFDDAYIIWGSLDGAYKIPFLAVLILSVSGLAAMAVKLMQAIQYKIYGGRPSDLKVHCLSAHFLMFSIKKFVEIIEVSFFSFSVIFLYRFRPQFRIYV